MLVTVSQGASIILLFYGSVMDYLSQFSLVSPVSISSIRCYNYRITLYLRLDLIPLSLFLLYILSSSILLYRKGIVSSISSVLLPTNQIGLGG